MKYAFVLIIFVLSALFPKESAQGIKNGLDLCLTMVIPSLFPLMFSSLFMMRTGLASLLSKPMSKVMSKIFRLPESAGFVLFTAMCGGYPAGAAAVHELYKNGTLTHSQARRLAYFAVSAGPAFVLGAVGGGIYNSPSVGFLLLLVLCVSVILTGLGVTFLCRKEPVSRNTTEIKSEGVQNAFVCSALDSAKTLLSVCIFVVIFAYLGELINAVGAGTAIRNILVFIGLPQNAADALLPAILEVSGGCVAASKAGFPLVAFTLGFGGLSVHFQIFSCLGEIKISKVKFILIRFVQGIICALLTAVTMPLLPKTTAETLNICAHKGAMPTAAGSVCLVIMCLMAVVCVNGNSIYFLQRNDESENQ